MALDAAYPESYVTRITTFTVTNGTQAKIAVDKTPASGNKLGGCRILDMCASSSDSVSKNVIPYVGIESTVFADMGAPTITATTNSTITRTLGSFITDGYQVGDLIMCFGTTNAGNSGLVGIVTSVVSGTLTLNGTTGLPNAETPAAGFRVFRISTRPRIAVALGSGVTVGVKDVQMVAATVDSSIDRYGYWLGPNDVYILGMESAVSALPAYISIDTRIALY